MKLPRKITSALLALCVLPAPLLAEGSSVYRATLSDAAPVARQEGTGNINLKARRPAQLIRERLQLQSPILGTLPLILTQRKERDWPAFLIRNGIEVEDTSNLVLFRGKIKVRTRGSRNGVARSWRPASAAIYDAEGGRYLEVHFIAPGPGGKDRAYVASGLVNQDNGAVQVRLRSLPDAVMAKRSCGAAALTVDPESSANPLTSSDVGIRADFKQLELNIYHDTEFVQRYPTSANSKSAAAVNAADTIYRNDLGMTFLIKSQRSIAGLTATDAGLLIDQFRSQLLSLGFLPTNGVDTHHLFTGKDLDGFTIGVAYGTPDQDQNGIPDSPFGPTCQIPSFSVGVTQDFSDSVNPIIFAHEIGHNFGAQHDDLTQPDTVMSTSLGNPVPSQFSSISRNEINTHLGTHGGCLSTVSDGGGSEPTPTPTATPTNPTGGGGGGGNPTATPTVPSGGGNNGGSGADPGNGGSDFTIGLDTTIAKDTFRLKIALDEIEDGCRVVVRSATSRGKVFDAPEFFSFEPDGLSTEVAVKLNAGSNAKMKNGANARVFFGVEYCGERSSTRAVQPAKVRGAIQGRSLKKVSLKSWISRLQDALESLDF